jgi:hypothetical protein
MILVVARADPLRIWKNCFRYEWTLSMWPWTPSTVSRLCRFLRAPYRCGSSLNRYLPVVLRRKSLQRNKQSFGSLVCRWWISLTNLELCCSRRVIDSLVRQWDDQITSRCLMFNRSLTKSPMWVFQELLGSLHHRGAVLLLFASCYNVEGHGKRWL